MDKIKHTQEAVVDKTTQRKDASQLWEFLIFCEGLGIRNSDALPARKDILITWASSYTGQPAGRTVGTKLLAIRKEHERLSLAWLGGDHLHRILKGVEELRPASSFHSKRAPMMISMLEDLNKGLGRSLNMDICTHAICFLSFFCQRHSGKILPPMQDLGKFNLNGTPHLHTSQNQQPRMDPTFTCHGPKLRKLKVTMSGSHTRKPHWTPFTPSTSTIQRTGWTSIIPSLHTRMHMTMLKHSPDPNLYAASTGCLGQQRTTFYLVSRVPPDMVKKFRQ